MELPKGEVKLISCPETEVLNTDEKSSNPDLNQMGDSFKEKLGLKENEGKKCDVFKKPVFLIGPRKGKIVGKVQTYKTTDTPDSITEAKELDDIKEEDAGPCIPTLIKKENYKSDTSTLNDNIDNKKIQKVSPAQKLNENSVPLPYKEPKWSGISNDAYKFEVLKNGSIVETIDLSSKPYFVFGRLSTCDIHMAHPTVSRFHAVLQFRTDDGDEGIGFYIYDLGSTHGTFLNKYRIKPNMYIRMHVGHLLKLGGSSRLFILHGPENDMEKESDLSVTELKQKRKEEEHAKELKEIQDLEEKRLQQEKDEKDGIDWGMGDDADEETDLTENPFAAAPNEELYLDDPKKTLRGWFEREGYELEYEVEEKGFGQFLCRVEVPVEFAKGGIMVAESLVKGKKKEAVVQCALEACRILDRYGLLRQAKHESRKRKAKNWEENDFYDSDEDEFLDRTGTVEKKRQLRMKAAGKVQTQTDTYETLVKKHEEILSQIEKIQEQLDDIASPNQKEPDIAEDEDALDVFMTNLSSEIPDHKLINKLKTELLSLRKEEIHVRKLVNIACPASLPKLIEEPLSQPGVSSYNRNKLSLISKRKIPSNSSQAASSGVMAEITKSSTDPEREVKETENEQEEEEEEEIENGSEEEEEKEESEENNCTRKELKESIVDSARECEMNIDMKKTQEEKQTSKNESNCNLILQQKDRKPAENSEGLCEINLSKGDAAKDLKVIGPALPPEDFIPEGRVEKRKKRNRQRQNKKATKETEMSNSSDPNYSTWLPPAGQSGDGRTKLNEKYGY